MSGASPEPSARRTDRRAAVAGASAAEGTAVHTRILRCMLAVEDSYAYWQHVDRDVPVKERARVAFEQRWFGTKSEARLRTIMTDMVERFDAYPEALTLLQQLRTVPSALRPWICHVHTQLADPIYRRFTGDLLPLRRAHGLATIDRDSVARWIDGVEPGRWSSTTCIKFASNLLATALDAGLVNGRRDPRKLPALAVPDVVLGYVLYLLRSVHIEGSITDNPYLRSLGVTPGNFASFSPHIPGIQFAELGGVIDLTWTDPDLLQWGVRNLGATA